MSRKIVKRVETEAERLKRAEHALRERIAGFRASDRLARDESHDRETPRPADQEPNHG